MPSPQIWFYFCLWGSIFVFVSNLNINTFWEFKWKVLTNVTTPGLDLVLRGSHPRPTNLAALTWETMLSELFRFVWEVSLPDDQFKSFPHSGWTVNQFRPQKIIQYRHRQACRLTHYYEENFSQVYQIWTSADCFIFLAIKLPLSSQISPPTLHLGVTTIWEKTFAKNTCSMTIRLPYLRI